MRIDKKSSHKKIIVAALIIAVIAAVLGVAIYFNSHKATQTASETPDEVSTTKPSNERTEDDEVSLSEGSTSTSKGEAENSKPDNSGAFSLTQTSGSVDGSTYRLRYLISTVGTGTCNLSLTKNGKVVTKLADVQSLASGSTCQGFDIPMSELSSGIWNANLKVTIGPNTQTLTHTITIP